MDPESPLRSVEDEIVEALERALKTKWQEDGTPHVLEPADSHALASYQAEVLTTSRLLPPRPRRRGRPVARIRHTVRVANELGAHQRIAL